MTTKGKLYEINFPANENKTPGFAMNVEMWDEPKTGGAAAFKGMCFLTPPDRGHMIEGTVKEVSGNDFVFTSSGAFPGDWTMKRITVDNFVDKCKKSVIGCGKIAAQVTTTEELEAWFYKEFVGG